MVKSDATPVILDAKRTPHGAFLGTLSTFSATDLVGLLLKNCLSRPAFSANQVSGLLMGCVLSAGLGQAPARQVVLKGGLLDTTPAVLLNKVCGSGMMAIIHGCLQLLENGKQILLTGGMESMSRAPYMASSRTGYKFGHQPFVDHMLYDGLEDAQSKRAMGCFAEDLAASEKLSRKAQDHYARQSLERLLAADKEELFADEKVSLPLKKQAFTHDEPIQRINFDKIETLKPAFKEQGTITAASASALADGASILSLSSYAFATKKGLPTRAFIRGWASFSTAPKHFTLAPVGAVEKLLKKLAWQAKDVDLWEINEAFAVVPMAFMRLLKVPYDKVNVWGGALGLGHPLGASGARVVVTLLHALEAANQKRGIAAVCIGGGEGLALALERP